MTDKLSNQQKSSETNHPSSSKSASEPSLENQSAPLFTGQQFSPGRILQMQRLIGNRRTQQVIQQSRSIIQRDPDGLIDLAPGIRGEVGIEGQIKKDAVVTKIDGSTYTLPADAPVFVHDIEDKTTYFVQIPANIITQLGKGEDVSATTLDNKKGTPDAVPVRGTVRKKDVRETTGQFTHKKVKGELFPHSPVPEDINQRALGNCYFLSALGSVAAQHPGFLTSMMQNGEDTVSVRLYRPEKAPKTGFKAEYVTVRKSVVKTPGFFGGSGLYSSTSVPWPALATKAYAAWDGHDKAGLPGFSGTYEGIAGGKSNSVFEHILGEKSTKENVHKNLGEEIRGLEEGELASHILPGHPKRPIVQPWNKDLYTDITIGVNSAKYNTYLTETDTPEAKAKAYLQDRVLNAVNLDIGIAKVKTIIAGKWVSFMFTLPYIEVMKNVFPGVGKADVQKWATFVNSGEGKTALDKVLKVGKTAGIMDRGSFQQLLKKAGIGTGARNNFMNYVKDFISGTPDDPYYNPRDIALYTKINDHLAGGGMVNASTPEYGKGGGLSGNEDVETVPGIAGGHAYTVLGVRLDTATGRRFVRVRNPWGRMGIGYNQDFTARTEIASGVFAVELSDFIRYYDEVQYSASTPSTDLAFAVANITNKQKKKKK